MKKIIVLIVQLSISILIIGGAILGGKFIVSNKKVVQKSETISIPPMVEVQRAKKALLPVSIKATGTVVPSKEVIIKPQVGGEIIWISSKCAPGKFVEKGDILFKIDSQQYIMAVENQKGQVAKALFELDLEKGRQIVARREWQLVGSQNKALAPEALALRKPHLANVEASLKSAESALARAELEVERCTIRAPFKGVVTDKFSDEGQIISSGSQLLKIVCRESFWVYATVPVSQIDKLAENTSEKASSSENAANYSGVKARVFEILGERTIMKEGTLLNVLPDLQQDGRLARVLIEVKDPLESTHLPLLLHSYVNVEIDAKPFADSYLIPRKAIREGDRIWIADENDQLQFRKVSILWRKEAEVIVRDGIAENDAIITSLISSPVPGMKLRLKDPASEAISTGDAK
jgi:RND family efflux transporter MFP subunit